MRGEPAFAPGAAVAILGLGVSGEAAARLAHARGGVVYASDVAGGPKVAEAAGRLRDLGVDAVTGGHDLDRILACELVVASPGISPFSDIRRRISAAGLRTVAEIELAYRDLESRVIGITGTNGKTTTCQLTAHLLQRAGISAPPVGNIGYPLSEIALLDDQPEWVVVELSSFQLADLEEFAPEIGVLLNLSPDHLDRYPDVESYYADKRRLFANAGPDSRWVLNADDDAVLDLAGGAEGEIHLFSTRGRVERGAYVSSDAWLTRRSGEAETRWLRASELRLLGEHNVANSLAASLAASLAGCPNDRIGSALRVFEPLPHRLQPVGERDGVLWVNDSKATNVSATRVALRSFDRPIVLILGGRHKGEPYSALAPELEGRVRTVVAYGEAAPKIVADLARHGVRVRVESGFESVVRAAEDEAQPGDVVLLAPACSSYDMFPNYVARGEAFAHAFQALERREGSAV